MKLMLASRNALAPVKESQSRERKADSPNSMADATNSHHPIQVYRRFDTIGS